VFYRSKVMVYRLPAEDADDGAGEGEEVAE
jgi:hypothetical protein